MKKCVRLQAALAAALVALPLGGCAPQQETGELRTIDVCEVTHSVFYAPQYVAMSQGFFAEEGLSVELTVGQGADKVMAAVLSGSVDIGLAGPEASISVRAGRIIPRSLLSSPSGMVPSWWAGSRRRTFSGRISGEAICCRAGRAVCPT